MRRILSIAVLLLIGSLSVLPAKALAHWGRWGCGSYYSGYTYCYPRYYYPNYNSCYYGNYGSYYYGNNYVPYPAYGYNPLYNNLGLGSAGLGGGNILGLLPGNSLLGANLSGSLLQPSYLSMPVSVGYGQSGFLQIPMGSPAGRGTYLQIPVNTGYGPSYYLQIELGRNSNNSAPGIPTPSTTPNVPPFGAVPGFNAATAVQFTYDIPKTPADEIPPVVLSAEPSSTSASGIAAAKAPPTLQFVSWSRVTEVTQAQTRVATPPLTKDRSFSLVSPDRDDSWSEAARGPTSVRAIAIVADRESTPWVVK